MLCGANRTQLFGFESGEQGEETIDVPDEEVQQQKSLRTPPTPTREDMAEHRSTAVRLVAPSHWSRVTTSS